MNGGERLDALARLLRRRAITGGWCRGALIAGAVGAGSGTACFVADRLWPALPLIAAGCTLAIFLGWAWRRAQRIGRFEAGHALDEVCGLPQTAATFAELSHRASPPPVTRDLDASLPQVQFESLIPFHPRRVLLAIRPQSLLTR